MTVGALRERLADFDDSLPVCMSDENFYMPLTEDSDGEPGHAARVTNAELPEHEQYVVIYSTPTKGLA